MDKADIFKLFQQFQRAAIAPAPKKTYSHCKNLVVGQVYYCKNFRIRDLKYGECLAVDINENGDWTILPKKCMDQMDKDILHYYNQVPWTMKVIGYDGTEPLIKFEVLLNSEKHLMGLDIN